MAIAGDLADFVIGYRYETLPEQARVHGEMLVASTIASAALGATIGSSRIVRALEVQRGGAQEASIWFGAPTRVPMPAAARVNALMSDAAASDDSDLRSIVHHGTTACAAALACADATGASGAETVAAIVLGYEVGSRLIGALQFGFKNKGFHGCIIASFAGAAAASRLLRLSPEQATHAIALTATSMGGLMAAANGSWAREYHAGQAAMAGVNAAQAAAAGFVAEPQVLEMPRGFLEAFGENADVDAITRGFGGQWSILVDMGIKLVPGGHPFHAIAEAAANAAREGDVAPADIDAIEVSRPGFQGYAIGATPTDLIGIAHSPAYFAAAGAADRDFGWIHAREEKILDPTIRGLLGKVRLADPPTEHLERYRSGAVVTIVTRGGRRWTSTVFAPRGAAIRGIEWHEIEDKYRALTGIGGMRPAVTDATFAAIRRLRHLDRVTDLTGALRAAAGATPA